MVTFSVIIPTRNEISNLPFLKMYLELFDEIIFVDGNSIDGTQKEIHSLFPGATVLSQGDFKGKGSAIILGLMEVSSDYVFILDADAPVDLTEVSKAQEILRLDSDIDLLKTSRHLEFGGSEDLTSIRSIGAKFFAALTRVLFRVTWTEMCYGFWALKSENISRLNIGAVLNTKAGFWPFARIPLAHSFEFDQLLFLKALKSNLRVIEIPSFELIRKNGQSNLYAPLDGMRTLIVILKERFSK